MDPTSSFKDHPSSCRSRDHNYSIDSPFNWHPTVFISLIERPRWLGCAAAELDMASPEAFLPAPVMASSLLKLSALTSVTEAIYEKQPRRIATSSCHTAQIPKVTT